MYILDKLVGIKPELRRKVFVTLVLMMVYRMGFWLPLPIVNQESFNQAIKKMNSGVTGPIGQLLQTASMFSASQVGYSTIFGLGIMPYISCSIVLQLLATVYPPLERMQKDGDSGRRRINELTRQITAIVAFIQSFFWANALSSQQSISNTLIIEGYTSLFFLLTSALIMTAGTMFLVWIGEQIDAFGVGSGISLLIVAGILAQLPPVLFGIIRPLIVGEFAIGSNSGLDRILMLCTLFVSVVFAVVFVTLAQRRIQIQSNRYSRPFSASGSTSQFLPLKLNQSGVMPIIFASSLLMIPSYIFHQIVEPRTAAAFNQAITQSSVYYLFYVVLIFFFSYFWAAVSFNPNEIAVNLKDNGSFVQGYRPGDRTKQYLEHVIVRVTFIGACFLSLIATLPSISTFLINLDPTLAGFYGGSGLLIVVSVSIDVIGKMDSLNSTT